MENQSLYLTPFQRKFLLKSLVTDLRPEYRRRVEIMLLADAGESQTQICETLGCSQETARYWIAMAQAGLAHNWSDRPMGRPKTVNEEYLARLKELASHSPREYGYPFQHWTAQWLSKHLTKELGIKVSACHINRLLKEMGLSTRPKNNTTKKETSSQQNCSIRINDLPLHASPNFLSQLSLIEN
ncbi:MAG: helix-turn-helix domain-containing protein [Brasilonema octagenarum HA4186-MV1]|uniref:Helix-turn-helix domain-containing protein n=2 Tax=Brasilonema TaxID=383614 RepID=A0A856MHQ2_9CYAN|nr:helix-turn-helix domain-containing protein [Brasilonema sennae]MBW4626644.1 helix-turn-helix domain-containing protein [Brasilonema octagenarum HA4186-MV1]NMF64964.1 helix-turn-helix domain-containing protein [Brasilonema octagenarum UFV-OR1]QDL09774.1 helix-turn-helix domain-containing protein [Brasilonema sennae CENA114]QDL16127.1 helix-turn-helix domain-containing protein [Brasilonema octagenarum UFV-E1]